MLVPEDQIGRIGCLHISEELHCIFDISVVPIRMQLEALSTIGFFDLVICGGSFNTE